MHVLIVYDSVFGNTERVARAIAEGLGGQMGVRSERVGNVRDVMLDGLDLLIAGSPTRAFRPT